VSAAGGAPVFGWDGRRRRRSPEHDTARGARIGLSQPLFVQDVRRHCPSGGRQIHADGALPDRVSFPSVSTSIPSMVASQTCQMRRNDSASGDRQIREGDLVVTAVAHHYAIGRLTADGKTQTALGALRTRAEALQRACGLAGTAHRVFLYARAGKNTYVPVECAHPLSKPPDA
jgi:hypothetical protein